MTRPICSDTSCERSVVRYRDGAGYCLFHPDAQPPVLDAKGRPVDPTPIKTRTRAVEPDDLDLDDLEPRRPRAPRPPVTVTAPADGLCLTDGCQRPWKHRGVHTTPKTIEPAPTDGLCPVDSCSRPWKHTGRHTQPWSNKPTGHRKGGRRPNPFDPAEAARRYLDGEGLFPLAADLHVGVKTLREALTSQGVQLRPRGAVIGDRGPAPRPIDPDECQRLYASGLNTADIARQLHVKTNRVQNLLRELGVLRPPGGRPPGAAALNAVRLKLTREESAAVRLRAATLGQPINHYLRRLVLDDLANNTTEDVA